MIHLYFIRCTRNLCLISILHDVEYLNNSLDEEKYDISKVSFYKWLNLNDKYELLKVGSAMGNGCGPILIGRGR